MLAIFYITKQALMGAIKGFMKKQINYPIMIFGETQELLQLTAPIYFYNMPTKKVTIQARTRPLVVN